MRRRSPLPRLSAAVPSRRRPAWAWGCRACRRRRCRRPAWAWGFRRCRPARRAPIRCPRCRRLRRRPAVTCISIIPAVSFTGGRRPCRRVTDRPAAVSAVREWAVCRRRRRTKGEEEAGACRIIPRGWGWAVRPACMAGGGPRLRQGGVHRLPPVRPAVRLRQCRQARRPTICIVNITHYACSIVRNLSETYLSTYQAVFFFVFLLFLE